MTTCCLASALKYLKVIIYWIYNPELLTMLLLQDKELRNVGDWRQNIEDKSGMDGRKKMFESEG